MDISLQSPKPSVTMLAEHVSPCEVAFKVYCHDSTFKKVTATDATGRLLFQADGATAGTSWSLRRNVTDGDGRSLFDFRHNSFDLKNGWVVESPDGRKLCSLVHKNFFTREHSSVNATVRTNAGENVDVAMRQRDLGGLTTTISAGDDAFAVIQKVEDNNTTFRGGKDRSVWHVRAAAGVDLSLVIVMALCRAEMGHVWKQ